MDRRNSSFRICRTSLSPSSPWRITQEPPLRRRIANLSDNNPFKDVLFSQQRAAVWFGKRKHSEGATYCSKETFAWSQSGGGLHLVREAPHRWTSDENTPGSQGQRLQHVATCPDASVHVDLDPPLHRVHDLRQGVDLCEPQAKMSPLHRLLF